MKKIKITVLCLCTAIVSAFGEEPADDVPMDTIALKEVQISARRLNQFSTGLKISPIEQHLIEEYKSQSVAELLAMHSQLFIKSYSNGGITSPSTRGTGANHTAILWNGFSLQDPMNGMTNLTNIPMSFIDEIAVQQGGAGALYGSGALGGAIHLNSSFPYQKGLEINTHQKYGSYQNLFHALNLNFSNQNFSTSSRLFRHTSQNNYDYINLASIDRSTHQLAHASYHRYGFLQSFKYKPNNRQEIAVNAWYQNSFNELPSTLLNVNPGQEEQQDQQLRITAGWKRSAERSTTTLRTAYFNGKNRYTNPALNDTSNNHTQSLIAEMEQKIQLGENHLLNLGINETYETASSENYGGEKNRNRVSFFTSYKLFNLKNTLSSTLSLRNEIINNTTTPLTYSLGIQADILDGLTLTSNVSKNYRIPTFNELYWGNWGNPDLKPEKGFSEDLGITLHKNFRTHSGRLNITAFNSNIDQWIIWVPDHTLWTPKNVQKVWSRGVETSLDYEYTTSRLSIQLQTNYNYTRTSNQTDNNLYNKQLIYVPLHQYNWGIALRYERFDIKYNESYTGRRYTSENNLQYVEAYTVGNIHLGMNIHARAITGKITFSVFNLWNQSYQVMAWYPMPLRNYAIQLTLNFNYKP
ncbi:MAG: TonB-dependent receptor [Bacteroidales bacterium]|jgi:iron complex outermembrane receptor protein|nr:TonB-dependent receptor [Bacteroidales bacterium]